MHTTRATAAQCASIAAARIAPRPAPDLNREGRPEMASPAAALCAGCRQRPPRPSSNPRGRSPMLCAECVRDRRLALYRKCYRARRAAAGLDLDPPRNCKYCGRYLERPSPKGVRSWRRVCNTCKRTRPWRRDGRRSRPCSDCPRPASCMDCGAAFREDAPPNQRRCATCKLARVHNRLRVNYDKRRARLNPSAPRRARARPRPRACATCRRVCLMQRNQRYCPECGAKRFRAGRAAQRRRAAAARRDAIRTEGGRAPA